MTLLGRALGALTILTLTACDPPCPAYWELACQQCPQVNGGCDAAKKRAAGELKEAGMCQEATGLLKETLAEPGGKNVVCSLPRKGGPPPKNLRGAWSCGKAAVDLGLETMRVNDESFKVTQFSTRILNLEMSPSNGMLCNLHPDGDTLRIHCPANVGALPGGDVWCTR